MGQHLADPMNRTQPQPQPKQPTNRTGAASIRTSPPAAQYGGAGSPHNFPDNTSMLDNMANNQQAVASDGEKPIMKYMEGSDAEQKSYPLKYFKGQDLELYYMEKQLKPGVEREIKEGFFEIRKKFGEG